uniref:PDZ and LIM domain protein 2-like n=1 Tax=Sinocyclocheilus grahami TaxID=75366 RepID=A0A672SXW7_SINGR
MMPFTVNLIGPSPWGFRISGGRDFKKAITVSKVNAGSKAETACLQPGDIVVEINGLNTGDMLNVEAQNKIKSCTTQLQLLVERPIVFVEIQQQLNMFKGARVLFHVVVLPCEGNNYS